MYKKTKAQKNGKSRLLSALWKIDTSRSINQPLNIISDISWVRKSIDVVVASPWFPTKNFSFTQSLFVYSVHLRPYFSQNIDFHSRYVRHTEKITGGRFIVYCFHFHRPDTLFFYYSSVVSVVTEALHPR